MSYGLSGVGFLGQAAGDGPKVITMSQVARALIDDILDFSIPLLGFKVESLIPDTVQGVLVNVVTSMLQVEFAEALDVTKEEAHTDMVGWKLAGEICNQMYSNGILFTDDPDDTMTKKGDGVVWIVMVGDSWKSPGELASFISNKLESIVTELTGVEAEAPDVDFDFGTGRPTTMTVMQQMGPSDMALVAQAPQVFAPVAPPSDLPIVPLAIAGIAALFLLG